MDSFVHVFVGAFADREDACLYTEAQWEAPLDDSASAEEFHAWEDRNPHWSMQVDLGDPYLDHDFIETIDGPDRFSYLAGLLTEPAAVDRMRVADNIVVLIFEEALGGFPATMTSTPRLKYCGRFPCRL